VFPYAIIFSCYLYEGYRSSNRLHSSLGLILKLEVSSSFLN
jgi:hypothetical protein